MPFHFLTPPTRLPALCGLLLAVLCCPSAADDESATVSVQFLSVPVSQEPRTAYLVLGGGTTMEVKMPGNELSQPYVVPRTEHWELAQAANQGEVGAVLAKAPVLAAKRQLVLAVFKDEVDGGGVELIAMEHEPAGSAFRFVNATPIEFSGQLDIERFSIRPGDHVLVTPEATDVNQGRRFCDVVLEYIEDEKPVGFFNNKWRMDALSYSIVILHRDADGQRIRMTVIREFLE